MAFGCLVVAAGGDGIEETLENGAIGVLVHGPRDEEEAIARGLVDAVAAAAASPDGDAGLRFAACERALASRWDTAAGALLDAAATARGRRIQTVSTVAGEP